MSTLMLVKKWVGVFSLIKKLLTYKKVLKYKKKMINNFLMDYTFLIYETCSYALVVII